MFRRILYLTMLMLTVLAPAVRSDAPATPSPGAASAPAPAVPPTNLAPEAGLVSLDFQDADIRNVLKVLAFKSGVNIVAGPDVTGIVNMELKDVPWQKALDVILSTYGYGFVRKDNIITVMTVEKLKKYREDSMALENQEPLVSKTFELSFAKAEDVMKIIDKLISKRGFMNFDERTNAIIIRDLESNLLLIAGVIKSLDTITPQVEIETKIIETDLGNSENLGIDWTVTSNISSGNQNPILNFSSANTPSLANSLLTASIASTPSTLGLTYGTINRTQLKNTLSLLSTRTNTKILSNPRIVTLDNQKAKIVVAEEYPVANYSFNSATGQEQVTGFTPLPLGITFEVTPHVNNAGLITLDLHPQITAYVATITVQNNPFPETNDQEAETNVMVEDGKTLVIGGLITERKDVEETKIPFLGDLPWVGKALFTRSLSTKTRQEILIFLTPHIITVSKATASAATAK